MSRARFQAGSLAGRAATLAVAAAPVVGVGQMIKQVNVQEDDYYTVACPWINMAMGRSISDIGWNSDGTLKALAPGASITDCLLVSDSSANYSYKPNTSYTLRVRAGLTITLTYADASVTGLTGTANQKTFTWTGKAVGVINCEIRNTSGAALPSGTDPQLYFGLTSELARWDAGFVLPLHILPHFQALDCARYLGNMGTNNSPINSISQIPPKGTVHRLIPAGDWQAWPVTPPEMMAKASMESATIPWCPMYDRFGYADHVGWHTRFAAIYTVGQIVSEFCNENWNYGFSTHQNRIAAKAQADGLVCRDYLGNIVPPGTETWHDWLCAGWAQGSLDTWMAAEQVYGRSRVIRCISMQAGDSQGWNGVLFYVDPISGQRVGDMMDLLAIAPYTGTIAPRPSIRAAHGLPTGAGAMDYPAQVRRKDYLLGRPRWTAAFAAATDEVVLYVQAWRAVLNANGWSSKRLGCYEGGFHEFYVLPEFSQISGEGQDGAVTCTVNAANNTLVIRSSVTFASEFVTGEEIGWCYTANPFPTTVPAVWAGSGLYIKLVGAEAEVYTSPTLQNASTRVTLTAHTVGTSPPVPTVYGLINATRIEAYLASLLDFLDSPEGVATRQAANTALMAAGLDQHSWLGNIGRSEKMYKVMSNWGLAGMFPAAVSDMSDTNQYAALKWFYELPKGITS